jgi:tRNA(Arg) A34 adenosine deaminase TadA
MIPSRLVLDLPPWFSAIPDWEAPLRDDEARMRLAIRLARENVERGTGGPFGAIVVERDTGLVVGAGVNSVVRLNNSAMHAEVLAIMTAQHARGSYTLHGPELPAHELVTSCEPCAMCLGAALWSGVRRLVCGAAREDANSIQFDEGPVFEKSYRYLEERGISVTRGVLREEARQVLVKYAEVGGEIYNG